MYIHYFYVCIVKNINFSYLEFKQLYQILSAVNCTYEIGQKVQHFSYNFFYIFFRLMLLYLSSQKSVDGRKLKLCVRNTYIVFSDQSKIYFLWQQVNTMHYIVDAYYFEWKGTIYSTITMALINQKHVISSFSEYTDKIDIFCIMVNIFEILQLSHVWIQFICLKTFNK